jgi:glycosyltransferase involved in cell wall biosynthesis
MITVVIPTYNEKSRLPATLRQMQMFIAENPNLISDILIVDDGSTDGTVEEAMKFRNKLPLKFHVCPRNVGKWNAISIGIEKSFGWILLLDADGAASIWELKKCSLDKSTASFGSRFGPGASVEGKSFMRSIVSWGYLTYVKICYHLFAKKAYSIQDFQCPFKLFHKSKLKWPITSQRFAGDIELAMKLRVKKLINIPIHFIHVRGSKVALATVFQMFLETPKIAWACRRLK